MTPLSDARDDSRSSLEPLFPLAATSLSTLPSLVTPSEAGIFPSLK
eukprot:CAMPEP_0184551576 /NCGR_PEP_ID=MMETSP0199_2-20130426/25680_1 /TAXON_ID=1112570 /ORGANISM="Thraustochytrium sp., Strain LLF1b" /LENGTH=45 /DNA_ID= /DNA_START= /DNA_END= /DNA_ORIENTATION=